MKVFKAIIKKNAKTNGDKIFSEEMEVMKGKVILVEKFDNDPDYDFICKKSPLPKKDILQKSFWCLAKEWIEIIEDVPNVKKIKLPW